MPTDLDRHRLAVLLGMLGSDFDGERAVAAAKASNLEEGRRAATNGQAHRQSWSGAEHADEGVLNDRVGEVLDICDAATAGGATILNLREKGFLEEWPSKIAEWGPRTFCSTAQWRWLVAIRDKLHRRGYM